MNEIIQELIIGIILLIIGIIFIKSVIISPFEKPLESANFRGWSWGILLIVGGIYTIIRAIIKLFH